jgi:hypothetical protein
MIEATNATKAQILAAYLAIVSLLGLLGIGPEPKVASAISLAVAAIWGVIVGFTYQLSRKRV